MVLQDRKMIVSRNVTFDEASLLKVLTGENVKALEEQGGVIGNDYSDSDYSGGIGSDYSS